MKAKRDPKKRRKGAALPRFLLLALLAGVGGTYMWAVFAAPEDAAPALDGPEVEIRFAAKAAKAPTATKAPKPQTDPALAKTPAPGKPPASEEPKLKTPPETQPTQTAAVKAGPASKSTGSATFRAPGTPAYDLPRVRGAEPLPAAPDPALVQSTDSGMLPKTGKDGRQPWRVYARPFDAGDKRPRIAIVISGLGLNRAATETAIRGLPGAVTLAFAPYAKGLDRWIGDARAAGHEVLLGIPMQPVDYPASDPGPQTLLTSQTPDETMARLRWALSRASGYVGVVDLMGSQFTESRQGMKLVLQDLKQRGLLYLDSRSSARSAVPEIAKELGLSWASNTRMIDGGLSREAIDARLAELERIAKDDGHAIGMGTPSPVTLERVAAWASGLGRRGFVLAPVSALSRVGPTG